MSLLDEGRASTTSKGSTCSVAAIRLDIGAAEFDEAMASDISTAALARAIRDRKYTVSADTLGRHRSGECLCRR